MTKAHLAATYTIGDPDEDMVEIPDKICECGLRLTPLLGRVLQSVMLRWDVWVDGSYEHVLRPGYQHVPKPIGDWNA